MVVRRVSYPEIRSQILSGDVIAFGGTSVASRLVRLVTRSRVSHVGVVLQGRARFAPGDRYYNLLAEATVDRGFVGVRQRRLSAALSTYPGDVWWLPLDRQLRRRRFDETAFCEFLLAQEGKPYDFSQAAASALDWNEAAPGGRLGIFHNQEDLTRLFCSELVAAALERAGLVGPINASEVSPVDLCRWRIYQDELYLLKQADPQAPPPGITLYNRLDPALWSETAAA